MAVCWRWPRRAACAWAALLAVVTVGGGRAPGSAAWPRVTPAAAESALQFRLRPAAPCGSSATERAAGSCDAELAAADDKLAGGRTDGYRSISDEPPLSVNSAALVNRKSERTPSRRLLVVVEDPFKKRATVSKQPKPPGATRLSGRAQPSNASASKASRSGDSSGDESNAGKRPLAKPTLGVSTPFQIALSCVVSLTTFILTHFVCWGVAIRKNSS
eukprot:GHVT01039753.1.p1 GENE.GHVT01039753.1~~GHVT01039753.1.p1  ORF type:complete len:217 (-),score=37.37 GHVT01039753.1:526-1176(-)